MAISAANTRGWTRIADQSGKTGCSDARRGPGPWRWIALLLAAGLLLAGCGDDDVRSLPESAPPLFLETFEDAGLARWTVTATTATTTLTTATAAQGTRTSYTEVGADGHSIGIQHDFATPVQPSRIVYYVRTANLVGDLLSTAEGYFVVRGATGDAFWTYFHTGRGEITISGAAGTTTVPYTPNHWYQFDVRNIDWTAKTLDMYVDGALVIGGMGFRDAAATDISQILLYNFANPTGGTANAWWDQILLVR